MRTPSALTAAAVSATAILWGGSPSTAATPPEPVPAAPVVVVSALVYRYTPGETSENSILGGSTRMQEGGTFVFANADPSAPHTVTGPEFEDSGTYLFDSGEPIAAGEAATVQGVETLPPGSYVFMCKLHGNLMRGELVIEPAA